MINDLLNKYLNGTKIDREEFYDLKTVIETIGINEKVLDWFRWFRCNEIIGWRPSIITRNIAIALNKAEGVVPVQFYSLFCPSYKKGIGEWGFRTDGVGDTTRAGIKNLLEIYKKTMDLGIKCLTPLAIFFDLAIEQPEKTINELSDLEINVENFKRVLPKEINFVRLSDLFPVLKDIIGYEGVRITPSLVTKLTMKRIIERGSKFYDMFGWTKKQIRERSETIASSEALVGSFLKHSMENSIMVYTPTMLERAQIYSGKLFNVDPLLIIFPKKGESGL